jgi:SNF2 family DNA or RNA helicase
VGRVVLSPAALSVRIEADVFPDQAELEAYRRAIRGSSYDREKQARVVSIERVKDVLAQLREARIDVEVHPDVQAELEREKKSRWLDVRGTEDRIAAYDRQIRASIGKGLRSYQVEGARWLTERTGALLADDPRMGKSVVTIVAVPPRAPVLIICPAIVKTLGWAKEFKKWKPGTRIRVLHGRESYRHPEPDEVLVVNYEILPDVHDRRKCDGKLPPEPCRGCRDVVVRLPNGRLTTQHTAHTNRCEKNKRMLPRELCPGCHPMLESAPRGLVVVGDEIHRAKAKKAECAIRTRALMAAARRAGGRSWGLSGTPMTNSPDDLWWVFQALGIAEEAFDTRDNFVHLFKGKSIDGGRFVWGIPDGEAADRIQRVAMRHTRREYWRELPEKEYEEVLVDVDRKALEECADVLEEIGGVEELQATIEQAVEGKKDGKVGMLARARKALATAKIPALLELVEEFEQQEDDPILVFSAHRAPIEALETREGWAAIHGGVDEAARTRIVELFQAKKLRGLACVISSAREGISLSAAGREIFVDQAWTPAANEQAEDRAVDVEQNRGLIVMLIKARHPIDEKLSEVLLKKRRIVAASVDAASAASPDREAKGWEAELRRLRTRVVEGRTRDADLSRRLHLARFDDDRARERVALELAEESLHLGLDAGGWSLARRILSADRGYRTPTP